MWPLDYSACLDEDINPRKIANISIILSPPKPGTARSGELELNAELQGN
jgi:hypothetical protein